MTDVVVMGIVIIGLVALLGDLLMRYLDHKPVLLKGTTEGVRHGCL